MLKKILFLIIFFYILALLETSFLIHFNVFRWIPNLILITVLLLNFFEKPKGKTGILGALFGGFFWDIFSNWSLGLHILILVSLAIFIKVILKRYIRIPSIKPR